MTFLKTDKLPNDYEELQQRYPQVKTIGRDKVGAIIIMAKYGKAEDNEIYDLHDPTSKVIAEKK